jgi:hypothetical protein
MTYTLLLFSSLPKGEVDACLAAAGYTRTAEGAVAYKHHEQDAARFARVTDADKAPRSNPPPGSRSVVEFADSASTRESLTEAFRGALREVSSSAGIIKAVEATGNEVNLDALLRKAS